MRPVSSVLLVSNGEGSHLALSKVLHRAGIGVRVVPSCTEARRVLKGFSFPTVLFCDTSLPDGTWADVLALATEGEQQVPVIVVSRVVDINLYINALEKGASDFIVPPFYYQDVMHVLKCSARVGVVPPALAA